MSLKGQQVLNGELIYEVNMSREYLKEKKQFRGFPALAWRNNTEGNALFAIANRKNVKDRLGEDTEMAPGLRQAEQSVRSVTASGLGALPSPSGLLLGMEDV